MLTALSLPRPKSTRPWFVLASLAVLLGLTCFGLWQASLQTRQANLTRLEFWHASGAACSGPSRSLALGLFMEGRIANTTYEVANRFLETGGKWNLVLLSSNTYLLVPSQPMAAHLGPLQVIVTRSVYLSPQSDDPHSTHLYVPLQAVLCPN